MQPQLTRSLPRVDPAEEHPQIRPDQVRNAEFDPSAVRAVVHGASRVRCQDRDTHHSSRDRSSRPSLASDPSHPSALAALSAPSALLLPLIVLSTDEGESAHRPLPSFVVEVEQIDGDRAVGHGGGHGLLQRIGLVAQCPLPEGDVAGSDPQGPGLRPEVLDIPPCVAGGPLPREGLPRLDDGHAAPHVAHQHGQVHHAVDHLDHGPATLEDDPVAVAEHDLLRRILQSGRRQNRTEADFEGALGDTGRPVGGSHRGECGHRQHERPSRGGERGDSGPVDHEASLD